MSQFLGVSDLAPEGVPPRPDWEQTQEAGDQVVQTFVSARSLSSCGVDVAEEDWQHDQGTESNLALGHVDERTSGIQVSSVVQTIEPGAVGQAATEATRGQAVSQVLVPLPTGHDRIHEHPDPRFVVQTEARDALATNVYLELEPHPNVLSPYISFLYPDGSWLHLLPRFSCDLFSIRRLPIVITETVVASIVFCVARGLMFMHVYGFVHRDVKSQNVLLNYVNLGNGRFILDVVLADFDRSFHLGRPPGIKPPAGTKGYAPKHPERYHDFVNDWYGFQATLVTLLCPGYTSLYSNEYRDFKDTFEHPWRNILSLSPEKRELRFEVSSTLLDVLQHDLLEPSTASYSCINSFLSKLQSWFVRLGFPHIGI